MNRIMTWARPKYYGLFSLLLVWIGIQCIQSSPIVPWTQDTLDQILLSTRTNPTLEETEHTERVYYHGESLIRLNVASKSQIPEIVALLEDQWIDVWSVTPTHIDVRTSNVKDLENALSPWLPDTRIQYEVLVKDLEQELLAPERVKLQQRALLPVSVNDPKQWFSQFHPLEDIFEWYKQLAQEYPERVDMIPSVGRTHENRDLMAIRIHGENVNATNNPHFYIQGGIHAREWISHATTQYIAYNLASSESSEIKSLLANLTFIIVPVVNPDGYVHTWKSDRLWRKNRRRNGQNSYGVDLNRNYPANWGHGGSSSQPFSETYRGPSAASEPETQALIRLFLSHTRIIAGLDLHAYSQLILRPIGWERRDCLHESQHREVSDNMAHIIRSVHGKSYISEKSIDLYPTTGAASDWFYLQKFKQQNSVTGAKTVVRPYGITIELRPNSDWWGPGFVLDPSEIIPTGEEILPAVLHFAKYSLDNILYDSKPKRE